MAEAVEILRHLLDGETVTYAGAHYQLEGAQIMRSRQDHLPILVGVNGREALSHAARHADIVGLAMLGRTRPEGQHHEVRWEPDRLDTVVARIQAAAGTRRPELQALVQVTEVTTDRVGAARALLDEIAGLTLEDALATPFLALGTADEIAGHLQRCRRRWGISFVTVRDLDAFAPVIERLRAADSLGAS